MWIHHITASVDLLPMTSGDLSERDGRPQALALDHFDETLHLRAFGVPVGCGVHG
jgi:hypothetical protein